VANGCKNNKVGESSRVNSFNTGAENAHQDNNKNIFVILINNPDNKSLKG
jgi:hypothetical protein